MFMNFNLFSTSDSNQETTLRESMTLVFPIKKGEHRCIILKQPPYEFNGEYAQQLKTLWSMVLLGPTFYC